MASLSIIGMPHVGNSYFSRCAVDGPSLSFRGLHPLGVLHPARAHWATPPPPLAWPSLPHYVPSTVLTLLQYLLRSHLLTYRAAPCSAETRWGELAPRGSALVMNSFTYMRSEADRV